MGNSKKNLRAFPLGARKLIGDELQLIQFGGLPKDAKPMRGIGSGVIE
jgi:phage-related protein